MKYVVYGLAAISLLFLGYKADMRTKELKDELEKARTEVILLHDELNEYKTGIENPELKKYNEENNR